tara:strand:+ start:659 stop:1231 length:573 start_codon:yes stop_codon:yes gene_type:complete
MTFYISVNDDKKYIFNKFIKEDKMCFFCKNKFNKHIYLKNKNYLCNICYKINNCNINSDNNFSLCYSKISQKDIVCKTYDFINNNKKIPNITDIDKNAMNIKLSIIEFIEIIRNIEKTPCFFNNYKLFLSYNFNIDYLIKKSRFLSDNNYKVNTNLNKDIFIKDKEKLNKYEMNLDEYNFIYNSLYNKDI